MATLQALIMVGSRAGIARSMPMAGSVVTQ